MNSALLKAEWEDDEKELSALTNRKVVFPRTPTSKPLHSFKPTRDSLQIIWAGGAGAERSKRQAISNSSHTQVPKFLSPIATHLQPRTRTSHRIATRPSSRRRSFNLPPQHSDTLRLLHIRSRKPSASRRKRSPVEIHILITSISTRQTTTFKLNL
ncbi:hypothetical protein N431DRAFT_425651 [Stipitochalara longipes BDJ]|nr:hypothetical protein N431DRAFT_425651 [Stipitochalara longipes BDJ]